jgi:hypothetical protein
MIHMSMHPTLGALALSLTLAAGAAFAQDEAAAPAAEAAPAVEAAEAAPAAPAAEAAEAAPLAPSPFSAEVLEAIGPARADAAQIVFFRERKFAGAAIGFKVREGEEELGKLRNGRYFVAYVTPGEHTYTVRSEARDVTTMEVEAGETYFVQGSISMGFMAGRPNLTPSTVEAFEEALGKLRVADPLEADDEE